jgi:peptide/nickel transport system substrate-binding protein
LADDVPTAENGLWTVFPDGRMETTWRIKPSARWHDGTQLVAADFLLAAEIEQDAALDIPRNAVWDLIESITAPDGSTITVAWSQPYIEADALFTYAVGLPVPSHLLERAYRDGASDFLASAYWSQEFIGLGPYRMKDWVTDSHVVLQANEGYVLGKPKIGEIELRFVPDPNTLMANLMAGVELTIGRALSLDQSLQLEGQWSGSVLLRSTASIPVYPQFVNPSPPVVAEVRFRRALLKAIDRQQVADALTSGKGSIAHTFVTPEEGAAYRAVQDVLARYAYDERQAVEEIQALGYTRGGDGSLVDAAGQRLTVPIYTTVQNDRNPKTTAAVAGFWRQVGVGVDEVQIPIQRARDQEYRTQFPGFEIAASLGGLDSRTIRRFHSASTPLPENGFRARGNNARYRSPDLDALVDAYLTTIPLGPRFQALAGIVRHQTEHLTLLPLYYDVTTTMVSSRIQNVSTRGRGFTEAWNAEAWDVTR